MHEVIYLHSAAPAKPAEGAPCNGCGVCCTSAPCPLGVIASRRLTGICSALVWSDADDADALYRCGLLTDPARHLPVGLRWLAPVLARVARRSIAAGSGCDCSMRVISVIVAGGHADADADARAVASGSVRRSARAEATTTP